MRVEQVYRQSLQMAQFVTNRCQSRCWGHQSGWPPPPIRSCCSAWPRPPASARPRAVAFRIIWRSVSEIFGVVLDLLQDLCQTST
jgi:hypothetical protein